MIPPASGNPLPPPYARVLRGGALVPFFLFGWIFSNNLHLGRPADSLWICHVAVLILGTGMLTLNAHLIRVGALFTVFGIPWWVIGLLTVEEGSLASTCSHLGNAVTGILALRSVRAVPGTWAHSVGIFLFLQLVCRWVTPPEMNVNLAFQIHPATPVRLGSFFAYWVGLVIVGAAALWITELLLRKLFPEERGSRNTRPGSPEERGRWSINGSPGAGSG